MLSMVWNYVNLKFRETAKISVFTEHILRKQAWLILHNWHLLLFSMFSQWYTLRCILLLKVGLLSQRVGWGWPTFTKANCIDAVLRCKIVGALKVTVPGTIVKVCFLRIVGLVHWQHHFASLGFTSPMASRR